MLKIRGLTIGGKMILAPMAGVTDVAFRTVCRELGFAGLVYTEMVSAKGICRRDDKSMKIAETTAADHPVAVQVFGGDPETIARSIEILNDGDSDVVDINMGCPMRKIAGNGEGAALMLNPRLAGTIVRAAVRASKKPVSVKIRKGWDEEHVNAVEFSKMLEFEGADMITIHGRTREQMYGGNADWRIIADVKNAVGIPVAGNGDVARPADAIRMLNETGCDAVMVGRAARGNPWLLAECERALCANAGRPGIVLREHDYEVADKMLSTDRREHESSYKSTYSKVSVFKRHCELAVLAHGEHIGVLEMRKHLAWYLKGARGAASAKRALFAINDYARMLEYIDNMNL